MQEIRHYGRPDQQELPPDQGSGYIWRLYSVARFEERDGGVYIELEAIALSRDIPVGVRWLVDPIVRRVSRNTLLISLQQMEQAVRSTEESANRTVKPVQRGSNNADEHDRFGPPDREPLCLTPETLSTALAPALCPSPSLLIQLPIFRQRRISGAAVHWFAQPRCLSFLRLTASSRVAQHLHTTWLVFERNDGNRRNARFGEASNCQAGRGIHQR